MPEVLAQEPQAETVTEQRRYVHQDPGISPALHERLIELGWTPPAAKFEEESGGG